MKYSDKAIITGHEGPFQIVTNIIQMDRFFMLMVDEPEVAKRILERMNLKWNIINAALKLQKGKLIFCDHMMIMERRFRYCFPLICGKSSLRKIPENL